MLKIDQLKAFSLTKLDFNHKATMTYGKRIGFVKEDDKGLIKTNPRNIIGKIGIACHPVFIKGKTIKVEVQMLNAEKKIVYLNKKSAIKWLNSQLPEYQKLSKKASDQEIIDTINHLGDMLGDLKDLPDLVASEPHSGSSEEEPIADANRMQNLPQNEPIAGGGEKENIFGEQVPLADNAPKAEPKDDKINEVPEKKYVSNITKRSLKKINDPTRARFWKNLYRTMHQNWTNLRLRFALQIREKTINKASEILATNTFRKAKKNVPRYQRVVNQHEAEQGEIKRFDEIPVTNKENYIKPAIEEGKLADVYIDGRIPFDHKRECTTGTSGRSTPLYRGKEEQKFTEKMTSYAAKAILGDRPYSLINGFALGPWATGITVTLAMNANKQAGLAAVGPNINLIYEAIKEQASIFGKDHPIIVSGYPPDLISVVNLAEENRQADIAKGVEESKLFNLSDYNIIGVVGGESMSENQREQMCELKNPEGDLIRCGFKKSYSSYGASDLDINIGYESDFEVELRKLCHQPEHKDLAEELFGKNEFIPMIFHYDPLNYHIESNEERHMYFTANGDRISPRVRYDLGDVGKTMAVSDALAILKKHGIKMKNPPNTSLPLLFVWGRQTSYVTFNGTKLAPENLNDTLTKMGLKEKISNFGFYQHETVQGRVVLTEVHLEFKDEQDVTAADKELLQKLIKTLKEVNTDFSAQQDQGIQEKLSLRVFKKGESLMSIQKAKYKEKKQQYIFKEGDEFVPQHAQLDAKGKHIALK